MFTGWRLETLKTAKHNDECYYSNSCVFSTFKSLVRDPIMGSRAQNQMLPVEFLHLDRFFWVIRNWIPPIEAISEAISKQS